MNCPQCSDKYKRLEDTNVITKAGKCIHCISEESTTMSTFLTKANILRYLIINWIHDIPK